MPQYQDFAVCKHYKVGIDRIHVYYHMNTLVFTALSLRILVSKVLCVQLLFK